MKRFAFICVLALAVAGVAAARSDMPGDGSLTVKNGYGRVVVTGRGAVIGRFDKGFVIIRDPVLSDGPGPIVTGADASVDLNETTTKYWGTNVRFRMIGGSFDVRVNASNIDLSMIGRGVATLVGAGTLDDGTYSLNGTASQPIPFVALKVLIGGPPQGPPPPPTGG